MILWGDSFDHYGNAAEMLDGPWASVGNASISQTFARTGASSLLMNNASSQARRVLGAAKVTAGLAGAFFFNGLPGANNVTRVVSFRDSANDPQVTVFLQSTGVMSVYRGNGTVDEAVTLLGSTTDLVTANAWNHIETKCTFDPVAGAIEIRLNGVTVLALSGIDTVNAGGAGESSTSQLIFGPFANGGTDIYLDDVIAWDTGGSTNNDFMGDHKVYTDVCTGDGADVAWTPSTGTTRFGVMDEIPPNGDTDYAFSATPGQRMGLTFPALDGSVVNVAGVVLITKSRKTDAGAGSVQVHADSSGSLADGVNRAMTTDYTLYQDVFEADPHTGAPWLAAAAGAVIMLVDHD